MNEENLVGFDGEVPATKIIDYRQRPEKPLIIQRERERTPLHPRNTLIINV